MKIEQLRYVLTIYETGSISKAAKALYLSQPNISNSVKNLEQELGFHILIRDVSGTRFTEKGLEFVQHCQAIMEEINQVMALPKRESRIHFTLVNPNYPPVELAFAKLCRQIEGQPRYQLVIRNAQQYESFKLVSQKKADLAMIISANIHSCTMRAELERQGLEYVHLRQVACSVNLAKDHPLAHDPHFRTEKLRDYPVVSYEFAEFGSPYGQMSNLSFVNLDRMLKVSTGNMRSRLITSTHAYGVGVQIPPKIVEEQGLHCIPLPQVKLELGYLICKGQALSALAEQFLQFLEEELDFLPPEPPQE